MADKVLIAYGSKYGSTREIADKIGDTIKKEGLEVDVVSAGDVGDISGYRGIVVGSAAYIGQWRKEVSNFVKKNREKLAGLPVWIFSSGPAGKGDPVQQMEGWLYPKSLQPVIDAIKPKDIAVFHGNIQVQKMNVIEKWMMKQVKSAYGDFRDWDAIASWGKNIAAALKG